ncbi:MAG TPA: PKD domain-containing protein [Chitinophagales bacterium]|nr:PKD domain-containing protein [Chitinophagales bacterium]
MNSAVYADHLIGGEMRYTYVKTLDNWQQVYKITTTIYRDAYGGGAGFDNPFYMTVFDLDDNSYKNKSLFLIASRISPITLNDLGACAKGVPIVKFEKIFYTFLDTVTINQKGYLYVHQRCCRSSTITNLVTPNQQGSSYTAHLTREAMLVNNSNAVFPSSPPVLMCIKSNFKYQFAATDTNGNQLKYYLCNPYFGADILLEKPITASPPPYSSVQYSDNYSFNRPFGDGVYVDLDSNNGLLKVESDRVGYFTLGICIDELNDQQQIIASSKRDFLFNVSDCVVATARASVENAFQSAKDVYTTCKNSTIQFRNQSIDAQTYFWDFGIEGVASDTSILSEPTFTYSNSGTYKVTLIINKNQTCADTTQIIVKVYPLLKADFNYLLNCEQKKIQLFNSSTSTSDSIKKITWYNDEALISTEDSFTYNLSEVGNYKIRLITETQLGCMDSVRKFIDLISYSKAVLKNSGIQQGNSDTFNICTEDRIVSFSHQSTNYTSFVWQLNNETKTEKSFNYSFPDTGIYKVELIVNPNTFCSDTSTQWINILPPLQADFSVLTSCQKNPFSFQIEINRPYDSIISAYWDFGDGTTSNESHPMKQFKKAQEYSVQLSLETQGGCKDVITKKITVNQNPKADFKILDLKLPDSVLIICETPTSIQFKNYSKNASSYSWTMGEHLLESNDLDISYTFLDTGTYSIRLISSDDINCEDTTNQTFQILKDIQKIDFSYQLPCAKKEMKLIDESQTLSNKIANYHWDFGNGVTSVKREPNLTYDISGPYDIILKIETPLGCKDSLLKTINIREPIEPIILQSQNIFCKNELIDFDASTSKGKFQNYYWEFGDGQVSNQEKTSISYPQEGTYTIHLNLEDSICGTFDTVTSIEIISIPEIELADSIIVCSSQEILLQLNYTSAFDSIIWSTGDRDTLNIMLKSDIKNVTVKIFYKGCEVENSIQVIEKCEIIIPQVFSPNGDGVNDYFNIVSNNIESFELSIYNKWGKLIFYTNDLNHSWDGTSGGHMMPTDNYIYYTKGIKVDGQSFELRGSVLLIK